MLATKKGKRRIINIDQVRDLKRLKAESINIKDSLINIKKEITLLLHNPSILNDYKFLRRIAISIKHIDHDATIARYLPEWENRAKQITHFLRTPIGAPFVSKSTLAQAAVNFSEQEPFDSDLRLMLEEMTKYGPKFALQLMKVFSCI